MRQRRLVAVKEVPVKQLVRERLRGFELRQLARMAKRYGQKVAVVRPEQTSLF